MPFSTYLTLYTPALDFILQAVASGAPESLLAELLERCRRHENKYYITVCFMLTPLVMILCFSSLLLNTIMAAFKPSYIASRTLQFLDLISQCTKQDFPSHLLLRTLGLCVCVCPPPAEQRRQIVNIVWHSIGNLSNPEDYIGCVEVWVQFVVQYFTVKINSV